MSRHIFCDLDGVLADFVMAALKAHAPPFFGGPAPEINDVGTIQESRASFPGEHPFKQLELQLGLTTAEFWNTLTHTNGFWARMPLFPWTEHLWESLNAMTGDVSILTSPPMGKSAGVAAMGKYDWVCEHLGEDVPYKTIICPAPLKCKFAEGNILIDDRAETCEEWEAAGGSAFRFQSLQYDGAHPTQEEVERLIGEVLMYL